MVVLTVKYSQKSINTYPNTIPHIHTLIQVHDGGQLTASKAVHSLLSRVVLSNVVVWGDCVPGPAAFLAFLGHMTQG